jgi:hypothetical protein
LRKLLGLIDPILSNFFLDNISKRIDAWVARHFEPKIVSDIEVDGQRKLELTAAHEVSNLALAKNWQVALHHYGYFPKYHSQ